MIEARKEQEKVVGMKMKIEEKVLGMLPSRIEILQLTMERLVQVSWVVVNLLLGMREALWMQGRRLGF